MSDIDVVTPRHDEDACELEAPDWTREDEERHNELRAKKLEEMSGEELDELDRLNTRNEAFIEAGLEALRNGKVEDEEEQYRPKEMWKERSNKRVWKLAVGVGCCFTALLVVLLVVASRSSDNNVTYETVSTMYGTVKGVVENGVAKFKGIPYARPPVGERRWKAPRHPAPWKDTLKANTFKTPCIDASGNGAEDCLYLNVYTPTLNKKDDPKSLPVMYFIHGGCYTWGDDGPTTSYLDGSKLVKESAQKVVLVTAEYRLAAFGFLGSEVLRDSSAGTSFKSSTGNYGLLDQRMVLDWIKNNIAKFGGDPKRVTIFGQSAGGGSVGMHLLTQRGGDNFHRAILQSGSFASWTTQSMQAAERSYKYLARALKCDGNTTAVLQCLQEKPAKEIGAASGMQNSEVPCRDGCSWAPVIDGVFLKDLPWKLLQEGQYDTSVALINFFTRDDGIGFIDDTATLDLTPSAEQLNTYITATYEAPGTDPVTDLTPLYLNESYYPRAGTDKTKNWRYYAAGAMETDLAFACPARRTSRIVSRANKNTYNMVLGNIQAGEIFVRHSSELQYLFTHKKALGSKEGVSTSKTLRGYWTNFAATGNPNGEDLPVWRPFAASDGIEATIYIDRFGTRNRPHYRSLQCDFWDAHWDHWGTCLPQPGREPSTCKTIDGTPCSPQFGIGHETFSRCVHGDNSSWCATSVDAAGNPLSTGSCEAACPTTADTYPRPRVHPTNQRP